MNRIRLAMLSVAILAGRCLTRMIDVYTIQLDQLLGEIKIIVVKMIEATPTLGWKSYLFVKIKLVKFVDA